MADEVAKFTGASVNKFFGQDVASFSLLYYHDQQAQQVDYTPIGGSGGQWLASMYDSQNAPSALLKAREDLWNGNIGAMQTNLKKPHNAAPTPGVTDRPGMLGMAYRYDQLNRLVDAVGHSASYIAASGNAAEFNRWQVSETQAHLYRNSFTYDPNGNIETQKRWDEMGVLFEDLAYQYNKLDGEIIQNRLYHVNDAISASAQEGDIEDQGTFYDAQNQIKTDNNYLYTAIGELQVDKSEDIEEIIWRVDSKIAEVRRTSNSTKKNLRFDYDAMGNRIAKHIYTDNAFTLLEKSTYYVRDASGNVMAVYDRIIDASVETGEFMLSERHIYGSSRIGMDVSTHVFGLDPYTSLTETTRELGHKQYEISNHLGNVLSVITDQKLPVEVGSLIVSYSAVVVTATDYSPFGVGLYGRSWSGEYRYGFNAKEVIGQSNKLLEYDARVFDPTLAQWLSIDPEASKYSYISPYSAFNLNPLIYIDPDGADIVLYSKDQNGKKKIAAVVKTDKAIVEYCIDERYLEVLKIASGTERQSSPILISIPNEVWDEIDTQIGAPDALILTAGVVGGMFTGGLASMSAVLFLDGPQNGELHLYTSTSAPFSNFAFIGGAGVELGAGTFSPPDNDPTAEPSSDNFSGASFSISVGFGALGGSLGLPAGQTEPNRGNPLHANGGWTTLTAGATIVGVPDLKSGGFVGEVETEHEKQLLECPE